MMGHSRRTTKTIYTVAAFYIAVGLALSAGAAIYGDRLSTFLGFVIVSGALGSAMILGTLLKLGATLSDIGEQLEEVQARLSRIESLSIPREASEQAKSSTTTENTTGLTSEGPNYMAELMAGTLDRGHYPRLMDSMESQDVTQSPLQGEQANQAHPSAAEEPPHATEILPTSEGAMAMKNLMREWKLSLRHGNLQGCQRVLAVMLEVADEKTVAEMQSQLSRLSQQTLETQRANFAQFVRDHKYDEALTIGERIASQWPNHPLAEEYRRIEPHLRKKSSEANDPDAPSAVLMTSPAG